MQEKLNVWSLRVRAGFSQTKTGFQMRRLERQG